MIELRGIAKSFPGVQALADVDFDVEAGEVHAIVGENGAGKSTLIKVLAGVYPPDAGEIRFASEPVHFHAPRESEKRGIHVIYQEFALFPELSVAENIMLGDEPRTRLGLIDRKARAQTARDVLARLGVEIDPNALVKRLSVADQQLVEIARALARDTKVLVLDEPTAVISGREVELLFERVRALKAHGVAVIYISHRLEEIFQIADRVTVLKDGRKVGTDRVERLDRSKLVRMMVGRPLKDIYPPKATAQGEPILVVEGLTVGTRVRDVSFTLNRGEVLGLSGMVGAGRSELALAIFGGLDITGGTVRIGERVYSATTPRRSIDARLALLTEDRKAAGLFLGLPIAANISATTLSAFARWGLLDFRAEAKATEAEIKTYTIAARSPRVPVLNLSGGNQQKVLISRWVRGRPDVLILDEPTRGVDVGAKVEIYRIIRDLAARGVAILMISSELPEIVGMCDRVLVLRAGEQAGALTGAEIDEERIMRLATLHPAAS